MELRRPAIEHGTTSTGRWLRDRRFQLAALIALVEGALVVVDVIPGWVAVLGAVAVIAFYLFAGRNLGSDAARQASWVAALSQVFVALVPVLVFVATAVAFAALAILAIVAVLALARDRR